MEQVGHVGNAVAVGVAISVAVKRGENEQQVCHVDDAVAVEVAARRRGGAVWALGAGVPVHVDNVNASAAASDSELERVLEISDPTLEVANANDSVVVPRLIPAGLPRAAAAAK